MTPLGADLETALMRALSRTWEELNHTHFRGALVRPALTLSESARRLGQWCKETRTIEISRDFVLAGDWGAVVEVLKHEMAHQFVSEVLGDPDPSPHGPAFRALCERLGIDGRASGVPAPADGGEEARLLGRVAKLLALAESPNVNEAELAMAEAQRLMLKHNLAAPSSPRGYGFRHLGRPTGRLSEADRVLAGLLAEHFFVECIWVSVWRPTEGKRGSVLEVCGTPANLELAAYVHAFLQHTAERLWEAYRRARGLRSRRDRQTYVAGVMAGFKEKLDADKRRLAKEGLVWVGDLDLQGYLKKRHPYVRWTRYRTSGRNAAHDDGRAAGRGVVLHRPVAGGPGGRRLLLPGR